MYSVWFQEVFKCVLHMTCALYIYSSYPTFLGVP